MRKPRRASSSAMSSPSSLPVLLLLAAAASVSAAPVFRREADSSPRGAGSAMESAGGVTRRKGEDGTLPACGNSYSSICLFVYSPAQS